jgi:hypothetical protein
MTRTRRLSSVRPLAGPVILAAVAVSHLGCGGSAGAWIWWMTDPEEKVKAEYHLGKGRLLVLIDEDKGWLSDASVRPLLMERLAKDLAEHKVNEHVVPYDEVVSLRQQDRSFDRRGAREIGQRLKADQVLHINVRKFTLHDEDVQPAYRGRFEATVKVLDVHATKPEDVRLWPRSVEGRTLEVTTDLDVGTGSGYDQTLTRRLCEEMAEKIAKLFYDHTAPKRL